jgi:hypothetical protein
MSECDTARFESIEAGALKGTKPCGTGPEAVINGAAPEDNTKYCRESRGDAPLERESIYSSIGAHVETILGCNQRLEMMKPDHCGT